VNKTVATQEKYRKCHTPICCSKPHGQPVLKIGHNVQSVKTRNAISVRTWVGPMGIRSGKFCSFLFCIPDTQKISKTSGRYFYSMQKKANVCEIRKPITEPNNFLCILL